VAQVKDALIRADLPMLATPTHIVPVMGGDAQACKAASAHLLENHGIYIPYLGLRSLIGLNEKLPCSCYRNASL
jgi:7-keto-8-aminopelargonate synthetase-like enzyme